MSDFDTIFAVASGVGRAAVAVMRISGPAAAAMLEALSGRALPPARQACVRRLCDADGVPLDQALVVWMPAPGSYTGEAVVELHLHAGPAVVDGVADALVALGGRPAEAGEFTRRAFLNGRMGLTEAEAVADLIEAESSAQRSQALRQLDGGLGRLFDGWSLRLTALLAEQEAMIDFPDETAEAGSGDDMIQRGIATLIGEIDLQLADDRRGERLRGGLTIAVIGPPNVGKSSLVNALAGREAAIVSPMAGTTRDVIEVPAVFGGVRTLLLDTAGLRESDDPVEREGVRRAHARAAAADLVMCVAEAGGEHAAGSDPSWITVVSKIDQLSANLGVPADAMGVSALTGAGMAELRALLAERARALTWRAGPPPLTRARHRAACLEGAAHLRAALDLPVAELRAEELRLARRALGRVTGHVAVDEVLDAVFMQFCIGK